MARRRRKPSPIPTPQRRKAAAARLWLFRTGAVVASLIVSLAIAEVSLRAFGPEYQEFATETGYYYTNPRGYFDVRGIDDQGRTLYGIDVHLGEYPLGRLPDHLNLRDKQAVDRHFGRDYRVLGLGDSFTFGQGVRYEDIYLTRLEKMLYEAGKPVAIRNTGVPGFDLPEILDAYRGEAAERTFDLVTYGLVLNDFGLPGKEKIIGSDFIDQNNGGNDINPWRERLATVNLLERAVESIRLSGLTKQLYLDAFTGENFDKGATRLRQLAADVRRNGSEFVIVLFPLLYKLDNYPFAGIHEKLARLCSEENIPLLDLLPAYRAHTTEELWVHPTDHHPNEIAHQIAAEELFRFLRDRGLLDKIRPSQPLATSH